MDLPQTIQERWESQGVPAIKKVDSYRKQGLLMIATAATNLLKPLHLDGMRENFETYVNAENINAQYTKFKNSMQSKYDTTSTFVQSQFENSTTFFKAQYEKATSFATSDKAREQYENVSTRVQEQYAKAVELIS